MNLWGRLESLPFGMARKLVSGARASEFVMERPRNN